jgi:hypothetical protein
MKNENKWAIVHYSPSGIPERYVVFAVYEPFETINSFGIPVLGFTEVMSICEVSEDEIRNVKTDWWSNTILGLTGDPTLVFPLLKAITYYEVVE